MHSSRHTDARHTQARHAEAMGHPGTEPTQKRSTVQVPANFDVSAPIEHQTEDETDLPRPHVSRWVLQMSASRPQGDAQTTEPLNAPSASRFRKPIAWSLLLGGAGAAAYLLATRTKLMSGWG